MAPKPAAPQPAAPQPAAPQPAALLRRIEELEATLRDNEETLNAIRRGEVDALVVGGQPEEQRIYTLESADRPYQVLIEQIQEGTVMLGADGTVLYCNRRLASMLGVAQERVIGQALQPFVLPEDVQAFDRLLDEARHSNARAEITLHAAGGTRVPVYVSLSLLQRDGGTTVLCGVLTDLTEQKLRLRELAAVNDRMASAHARLLDEIAERERVEDALRQSQKMEAVGQLTGGLAHDFNNLLTGITGSLELLQARLAQGRIKDIDRYVSAAHDASKRAAALTHRLLAFSRRQTLDPRPTGINRLVTGMEELIRRTAGPQITVEVAAGDDLWNTLIDPHQMENALLNLCINARDAMPDGGRLIIGTANRWLDEGAARERELPPGPYVALCIADTGTGMTPEVMRRAFDPFYTTKPLGQGTGLGLSMVYGFVRQSGGQVHISSEPGRGTVICLYLPRHLGAAEAGEREPGPSPPVRAGQGGAVLVVDDEPTVRMLVSEVLEELGYEAIEAVDGPAGVRVLRSDLRIDLLITDVGLPGGMNGRQVADAGRELRPGLKVLFITGYAENAVIGEGHLEPGMHVMTKPFAMEALASRIRELIVR